MKELIQLEDDKFVRKICLYKRQYSLGRGTGNDIVFDTAKVSRLHALLVEDEDTYYIINQDSKNHVFVNGERVEKKKLISGDKINLSPEVSLLYLAEIEETETHYRQFVEFSPESITVHSEGKIVFVNPATVKLLGAEKPEDLIGKSVLERVHPDYRDIVTERIRQEEQGKPLPPLEEKFLRLDGSAVDVEVIGVPLTYQGKPAVLVIARDIARRKRMEQELLRAQKLESVGVLAGGIAHDFNNILQVVRGNALMAKATPEDKVNVELCLTAIEKAVSHAVLLTSQLLTFARGGTPITRSTSIKTLIEESVAFALRGSNVAYTLHFAEDLRFVEIDSDQINQVIHNLVINADQAMPQGGTITISASNVEVTEAQPSHGLKKGHYVKVSIRDQGVGMSNETLQKIFDPYFTTKEGGSGLGLASCYSIVTKHGGIIEAESEQGKGSVFTLYLPASSKQSEKDKTGKRPMKFDGRVLIMDDDEMVREIAARMLKKIGCDVEIVSDGAEAIERYLEAKEEGRPFDIVIFDLTVPGGMGGKQAIEKLRRHDPDIKAIVSSGYSNDPVMANPEKYGFQGVVAKPFRLEDLVETMKEILRDAECED